MERWAQIIIDLPSHVLLPTEISRRSSSDDIGRSLHDTIYSTTASGHDSSSNGKRNFFETITRLRWRGVIALVGGFFQQTLCWGMIMTYGCILAFYTDHLLPGTSKVALAAVGALPPFLLLALSLLWGRLLDAGHHRTINTFAGFCLTAGFTGLAFTDNGGGYDSSRYWQILLASIPIGIGQSCYFIAAPHVAKTWYPKRKGLAMGITNCGASVGGVIWPIIFTQMTAKYSFRVGIGTLAGISALLGTFIVYASIPAPSFERRPVGKALKLGSWIPTRGFRSITFVTFIAAMCCAYLATLTVPFFIEYWAQMNRVGIPQNTEDGLGILEEDGPLAVYLVVIMNACQLPGRLLGSSLCDQIKARKIHATSCIAAVLIVAPVWPNASTFTQGCIFAALFGLNLGITVSLPINDVAEILGPKRAHSLGQYAGVVYTTASPFMLVGAVISGAIVDYLDVNVAGIWAVSCFGASAALIILSLVLTDDTWKFDVGSQSLRSGIQSDLTLADDGGGRSSTEKGAE